MKYCPTDYFEKEEENQINDIKDFLKASGKFFSGKDKNTNLKRNKYKI